MIPRVFHHIWLGSVRLPDKADELREAWRHHHPDWEFRLWTDSNLQWLRNYRLFSRATSYSQKSDIARYEIVERFGGIYLDTDVECLRNLGDLLQGYSFFGGLEPSGLIASCIFGAERSHPFLREVIASFPMSCLTNSDVMNQTGPGLLTKVFKKGGWENRADVRIYPASFFNVYGPDVSDTGMQPTGGSYAVHHSVYSWKGDTPSNATIWDCVPRNRLELRIVMRQLFDRMRSSIDYRISAPLRSRLSTWRRR